MDAVPGGLSGRDGAAANVGENDATRLRAAKQATPHGLLKRGSRAPDAARRSRTASAHRHGAGGVSVGLVASVYAPTLKSKRRRTRTAAASTFAYARQQRFPPSICARHRLTLICACRQPCCVVDHRRCVALVRRVVPTHATG